MPATTTLSTTTLLEGVDAANRQVRVASTSGLTAGIRLFIGGELMEVVSLGVDPWVNVRRGVDGTAGTPHDSLETIYIGRADQFYSQDPIGAPPAAIPVSPYINVINGTIWFSQGNAGDVPSMRWWQKQTVTYGVASLGVLSTTLNPTSST